jgi:hypothetical protein
MYPICTPLVLTFVQPVSFPHVNQPKRVHRVARPLPLRSGTGGEPRARQRPMQRKYPSTPKTVRPRVERNGLNNCVRLACKDLNVNLSTQVGQEIQVFSIEMNTRALVKRWRGVDSDHERGRLTVFS